MLFLFIIISHKKNNFTINTELKIQQMEHPDTETIMYLQNKKLPTIYIDEIGSWEGIDLLIGQEYDIINEIINDKTVMTNIKNYIKPFSLSFTKSWDINLVKNINNWENLPNQPIKQNNINHYIATLSGLTMILLINPSDENNKIINNNENIKNLLSDEENSEKIDYIIIPLRLSNMIYIPYGWYYWIYNGLNDKYCCYLELNNKLMI